MAGGYQLRTRPEFTEWIKRLLQPKSPRVSKAALETLAIIAYKQPIIRSDIEHIRGVDSGGVLRVLLERNLVRILGRKKIPGRPLIYATTKLFLEVFDLKDLRELPTPKEIEALVEETIDPADGPPEDSVDPNQMQLFEDGNTGGTTASGDPEDTDNNPEEAAIQREGVGADPVEPHVGQTEDDPDTDEAPDQDGPPVPES